MLNQLCLKNNPISDLEYYEQLKTNRKIRLPSSKKIIQNISSSSDEISRICSKNVQLIFSKKKNKCKYNNYTINSYQYLMQKASIFVNKKQNNNNNSNNKTNTIRKIREMKEKITPIKKQNKKLTFSSSICPNNNKNRKSEIKRNLSICPNNNKNIENNKSIKEIRIKSSKKLSQIFPSNNRYNAINNEEKIMTISNINRIEKTNDFNNRNKKFLGTPKLGIYSRKTLKPCKSLSIEKKLNSTIKSIEIDFGHKIYGNSFSDQKCLNSFKVAKIIVIQRYFRKYLELKNKNRIKRKIFEGIQHLKNYMLYNMSISSSNIFFLYRYKLSKIKSKKWMVKKEQYDLLKRLKEKNIFGMISLKKYIVKVLNNNKLELL